MAIVFQVRYDQVVAESFDILAPVHRSAIPASVVRWMTVGFDNFLADYYWVWTVQAFTKWGGDDAYYAEYYHVINTIDPRFEYPYTFGILTVPRKSNPESLVWMERIARDGVRAFPENWRIPFSAAMGFHITGGRGNADALTKAIEFLDIATAVPDAPQIVHQTHAIYLMKEATDYKKSRSLFVAMLETADNEETKKIMSERLALLDLVEKLEQRIAGYHEAHGGYPDSIATLTKIEKLRFSKDEEGLLAKFNPQIDINTGKILLR